MYKRSEFIQSQQGQSIILIAAVMIGLLAFAGLAIDGGNMFLQRRRVQNAADAGAMAGTRALARLISQCEDGDSGDDDEVAQAVTEYVANNGFSESVGSIITAWYVNKNDQRLGQVGAGSVPQSAAGVEVEIEAEVDTFFLPVVGIESADLGGQATAMSGRVVRMPGGVLPIAVPVEVVETLEDSVPFVVMENNQHKGGMFCEDANGNGQYDEGLDLCIGDPASHNAHRGWLNLNYIYNTEHLPLADPLYRTFEVNVPNRGCGPDPDISTDDGVRGWAGDGCPYPYSIIAGGIGAVNGDFIHGGPGARQSSLSEVIETYNDGPVVYIPIFDYIYMSDYMDDNFDQPEGIGWPRAGGGGHAYLYHIVGFTAVIINDPNPHDHTLAGEFQEALIGDGVIQPAVGLGVGTCQPSMLFGINLWE